MQHFQLYENKMCITYDGLVPRIIKSKGTYDSLAARKDRTGRRSLEVVRNGGGTGRCALIAYETLPAVYKNEVLKQYGDPYELLANKPITERVVHDIKAEKFYREYVLPNGKHLPDGIAAGGKYDANKDHVKRYTIAASWLNMLCELTADKQRVKKELNITMGEFWKTVAKLIQAEHIDLPKARIRLQQKIAQYAEQGYECLIVTSRYGNNNSKKVKTELAAAVLLELCANPRKHDDVVIMTAYNKWAKEQGQDPIKSKSTVGNWRRKNDHLIRLQRDGNSANYEKYGEQIKRKRPSAPLLLVESDDNDLDLYYIEFYKDKKGHNKKNHFKRFVLMVVIDPYNDYILGWAMGDTQTKELVKAAYYDAVLHIREMTGGLYLPHEVKSDRWGLDVKLKSELAQFYQSLAIFRPAAAKAPRGKYIERSFGKDWHRVLKLYPNYAGTNVKSKTSLNPDEVALQKNNYPTVQKAPEQVAAFIEQMRQYKGKQAQWLEAFNKSDKSKERAIGDAEMLLLFGQKHLPKNQHEGNRITNGGVDITVDGISYNYMMPEELYLPNVGKQVQVIYEPRDMSRVLITDGDGLRVVIYEPELMPSALADYEEGDGKRLKERFERKERTINVQISAGNERKNLLEAGGVHAESLLQAGVLDKGAKQIATHQYLAENSDSSGTAHNGNKVKELPAAGNDSKNDKKPEEPREFDAWEQV